ncbi:polyubiquitin 3 [Tanacetum coccineum]
MYHLTTAIFACFFQCTYITIKTCTGKTITLEVKGSDTIFYVKSKIQSKVGIPVEEQALIFDDMLLEEDLITLANFGINRGSTLTHLHRSRGLVPIFVKFPNNGPSYTLRVKLSDTINNVKAKIPNNIATKLVLIFNNTVLDDNITLCDFDIKKGSTLTAMRKKEETYLEISVKTPTRKIKLLEGQPSYTIARVKYFVGDPAGVLIFNETVLKDSSKVSDFDIKNGSTLTLLPKSAGHKHISVSVIFKGENIPLEVKHSDTILYVKSKIHDIEGILTSEQILLLNGKRVMDSRTLDDYDIHKDTLDLFRSL